MCYLCCITPHVFVLQNTSGFDHVLQNTYGVNHVFVLQNTYGVKYVLQNT